MVGLFFGLAAYETSYLCVRERSALGVRPVNYMLRDVNCSVTKTISALFSAPSNHGTLIKTPCNANILIIKRYSVLFQKTGVFSCSILH